MIHIAGREVLCDDDIEEWENIKCPEELGCAEGLECRQGMKNSVMDLKDSGEMGRNALEVQFIREEIQEIGFTVLSPIFEGGMKRNDLNDDFDVLSGIWVFGLA